MRKGSFSRTQVSGGLPRGAPDPLVMGTDGDISSHAIKKPPKARVLISTSPGKEVSGGVLLHSEPESYKTTRTLQTDQICATDGNRHHDPR